MTSAVEVNFDRRSTGGGIVVPLWRFGDTSPELGDHIEIVDEGDPTAQFHSVVIAVDEASAVLDVLWTPANAQPHGGDYLPAGVAFVVASLSDRLL